MAFQGRVRNRSSNPPSPAPTLDQIGSVPLKAASAVGWRVVKVVVPDPIIVCRIYLFIFQEIQVF